MMVSAPTSPQVVIFSVRTTKDHTVSPKGYSYLENDYNRVLASESTAATPDPTI